MRFQQEIESAHLIAADALLQNAWITFERKLAIGGFAKELAGKYKPRIFSADAGKMLRQAVLYLVRRSGAGRIVGKIAIFQAAGLLVKCLKHVPKNAAAAFDIRGQKACMEKRLQFMTIKSDNIQNQDIFYRLFLKQV